MATFESASVARVIEDDLSRAQGHINAAIDFLRDNYRASANRQAVIDKLIAANWDILPARTVAHDDANAAPVPANVQPVPESLQLRVARFNYAIENRVNGWRFIATDKASGVVRHLSVNFWPTPEQAKADAVTHMLDNMETSTLPAGSMKSSGIGAIADGGGVLLLNETA